MKDKRQRLALTWPYWDASLLGPLLHPSPSFCPSSMYPVFPPTVNLNPQLPPIATPVTPMPTDSQTLQPNLPLKIPTGLSPAEERTDTLPAKAIPEGFSIGEAPSTNLVSHDRSSNYNFEVPSLRYPLAVTNPVTSLSPMSTGHYVGVSPFYVSYNSPSIPNVVIPSRYPLILPLNLSPSTPLRPSFIPPIQENPLIVSSKSSPCSSIPSSLSSLAREKERTNSTLTGAFTKISRKQSESSDKMAAHQTSCGSNSDRKLGLVSPVIPTTPYVCSSSGGSAKNRDCHSTESRESPLIVVDQTDSLSDSLWKLKTTIIHLVNNAWKLCVPLELK